MDLATVALKGVVLHKPLTYIQQTVNILTIEHVYRYATLLLGVHVCLRGVRTDT